MANSSVVAGGGVAESRVEPKGRVSICNFSALGQLPNYRNLDLCGHAYPDSFSRQKNRLRKPEMQLTTTGSSCVAVCIVDFAVGSPKVDCCSDGSAAQHPQLTEGDCYDNAKILDRTYKRRAGFDQAF